MKQIAIFGALLLCTAMESLQAQQLQFGGAVLDHDIMMGSEFAQLSQTHNFGTARSMALGGAFTSLGADLSSMSINPAGLGMYRRSEFSITPMMSFTHSDTPGTQPYLGSNKNRFAMANFGVALNVFENPSTSLTSVTIGFGMNRIADFNTRNSFSSESRYDAANPNQLMPTIADIFGQQLGQNGIFPDNNGNLGYNINPYFWPAVLGYNGYMISAVTDKDGKPMWVPDCIGHNASVLHSMDVINTGSINEFTFSVGMNFNNIVYVGGSLGVQSVHKKQQIYYQEEYGYFGDKGAIDGLGAPLESQLNYMGLYQQSVLDGSGVNFKLGVIVRPIESLRLGVAFHTPTFYSLDRTYGGDLESQLRNNVTGDVKNSQDVTPVQRDEGPNSWDFVSPSRLLFGASYMFGHFGLITVDYERDWYNGIRVKNVPEGPVPHPEQYKREFKQNFRATNTLRAGIEMKPIPMLALRVGGGYSSSMLKDKSLYFNAPLTTESYYFSAGVGVALGANTVLDVAYQNVTNKQSDYQLFYSRNAETGDMMTYSGLYNSKLTRHYVSLTLGFKF
ncbi:MAG: transporter [Alistipes sp.]